MCLISLGKPFSCFQGLLAYFRPGPEVITWMGKQSRQSQNHLLMVPSSNNVHHFVWPSKLFTHLTLHNSHFMSAMNNTARLHLSASIHCFIKAPFPPTNCHKTLCQIAFIELSTCWSILTKWQNGLVSLNSSSNASCSEG